MQDEIKMQTALPTSSRNSGSAAGRKGRKTYKCPYDECGKVFTESGNLKAHIRVHVLDRTSGRQGKDLTSATTQDAARPS